MSDEALELDGDQLDTIAGDIAARVVRDAFVHPDLAADLEVSVYEALGASILVAVLGVSAEDSDAKAHASSRDPADADPAVWHIACTEAWGDMLEGELEVSLADIWERYDSIIEEA